MPSDCHSACACACACNEKHSARTEAIIKDINKLEKEIEELKQQNLDLKDKLKKATNGKEELKAELVKKLQSL